jgi:hypothetical protein
MNFNKLYNPDFLTDNYGKETINSDLFTMSIYMIISIFISWLLVPIIIPRFKNNLNKKIDDKLDVSSYSHGKGRMNIADLIHHQIYLFPLTYFSFVAACQLKNSFENRWYGKTWESYMCLIVYISGNFIHIPITLLKEGKVSYRIQMLTHHGISIYAYSFALYNQETLYYSCLSACCELSTIFLNQSFLLKEYTKSPLILAINGILLWLSFIFLRLILFPYVIYNYYNDYCNLLDKSNHVFIFYVNIIVMNILILLSLYWMKNVTRGMIKVTTILLKEYKLIKKD